MVVFKPDIDTRYTDRPVLHTHDGVEFPAIKIGINRPTEIIKKLDSLPNKAKIKTIAIDEVNLYPKGLIGVVNKLLERGYQVIATGILLDTEKGDFGQTSALMGMAETVEAIYAKCAFTGCLKPAPYSFAKKVKQTQVVVGAEDLYGAACADHYELLHVPGRSEGVTPIKQASIDQLVDYGIYPAYAQWLREINYPHNRKVTQKKSRWPKIEIGGDGYAMGKTKLMKQLVKLLRRQRPAALNFTVIEKVYLAVILKRE